MGTDDQEPRTDTDGRPWRAMGRFVRDFMRFSGRRGIWGALLVLGSALLESIGLILLIPLLGITIGALPGGSALTAIVRGAFALFGLGSHFARLRSIAPSSASWRRRQGGGAGPASSAARRRLRLRPRVSPVRGASISRRISRRSTPGSIWPTTFW
jgi:hypothetical protein